MKNVHFSHENQKKLQKQHLFLIDELTYRIIQIIDSGKKPG